MTLGIKFQLRMKIEKYHAILDKKIYLSITTEPTSTTLIVVLNGQTYKKEKLIFKVNLNYLIFVIYLEQHLAVEHSKGKSNSLFRMFFTSYTRFLCKKAHNFGLFPNYGGHKNGSLAR